MVPPVALSGIAATTNPPDYKIVIHVGLPNVLEREIDKPDGLTREFTKLSPQAYYASMPNLQKNELIVRIRSMPEGRRCPHMLENDDGGCKTGTCWVSLYGEGDVIDVKHYRGEESQVAPDDWDAQCGMTVEVTGPHRVGMRKIYLLNPAKKR